MNKMLAVILLSLECISLITHVNMVYMNEQRTKAEAGFSYFTSTLCILGVDILAQHNRDCSSAKVLFALQESHVQVVN